MSSCFVTLMTVEPTVWAIRRRRPDLRDREIIVAADDALIACSAGLRRLGVRPGWSVERACGIGRQSGLEPFVCAPPGLDLDLAWEDTLRALHDQTPFLESPEPGLLIIDLGEPQAERKRPSHSITILRSEAAHSHTASELGSKVCRQADVKPRETAFSSHVSTESSPKSLNRICLLCELARTNDLQAGCAADRQTSWLAALSASVGDCRDVAPGGEDAFRASVAIETLLDAGISADTVERLQWLGITTVGGLTRFRRTQLVARFPEGDRLFEIARNGDRRPVSLYSPPPEVRGRYLDAAVTLSEHGDIQRVLHHLLDEAVVRLGPRSVGQITMTLAGPCGRLSRRRLLRTPIASPRSLRTAVDRLLADLMSEFVCPEVVSESLPRLESSSSSLVSADSPPAARTPRVRAAAKRGPGAFGPWRGQEGQSPRAFDEVELVFGRLSVPDSVQGRLWPGPDHERARFEQNLRLLEKRFPGRLRRIVLHDPDSYLPEDAFTLVPAVQR